jgi:hypothetical protein
MGTLPILVFTQETTSLPSANFYKKDRQFFIAQNQKEKWRGLFRDSSFQPANSSLASRVVGSIVTGRDEPLPKTLLSGDKPGKRISQRL